MKQYGIDEAEIAISIHALREEGDSRTVWDLITDIKFLSTPSARRATVVIYNGNKEVQISIHALREEGDRGGRRILEAVFGFLSTPSARRATTLFSIVDFST